MTSEEIGSVREDEIRKAAELREFVEQKISDLEMELERYRDLMNMIDSKLRKSSFVPAARLRQGIAAPVSPSSTNSADSNKLSPQRAEKRATLTETRQLRRTKDGELLANVSINPDRIEIVPSSEIVLPLSTPPFQSFFVNRILKGYETKDRELVQNGKLDPNRVLVFEVSENDGRISKVTVTNYRENARLNEILSTVTWAFTRMLEKK